MHNVENESLVDEALHAFWQVVAEHFPQAASGDLSPLLTIRLKLAASDAVEEWVAYNVPSAGDRHLTRRALPTGHRFRLIRPVDRFPDFVTPAGLTGAVTDAAAGVWAEMDQPVPGAAAWDNELYWDTIEEFLQDTEALA